ncbi:MAG: hypothetical protein WAL25_02695 [Acidimicrobiia bacterium]
MKSKIWAALIVGGLLVGAGFVTSVVSSPGTASAQETTDEGDFEGPVPRIMGFLGGVLDGLVSDGTIDQDQADAIVDAAEAKATELREEHEADRKLLEQFLEDDVITQDEAAQLSDDHPLLSDRFDGAWEDGELTRDELRGFGHHLGLGRFRRGFHLGGLLDDGGIDQEEYDALPEDHPLKGADVSDFLDDGLITPDELRQLLPQIRDARPEGDA